jgi:hypothetical protein
VCVTIAACGGDDATAPLIEGGGFTRAFVVENRLLAPVTIAIDSIPFAMVNGGDRTALTVKSKSPWLIWRSAEPLDNEGHVIPDDLEDVQVSVIGINQVLEITNVVREQTYITGSVFNKATQPVSIGVYDGVSVACVAVLPARSPAGLGFVQFGYYRLLPATEVRAYDGLDCTGAYLAWPKSAIQNFQPKSGAVRLVLETAP